MDEEKKNHLSQAHASETEGSNLPLRNYFSSDLLGKGARLPLPPYNINTRSIPKQRFCMVAAIAIRFIPTAKKLSPQAVNAWRAPT